MRGQRDFFSSMHVCLLQTKQKEKQTKSLSDSILWWLLENYFLVEKIKKQSKTQIIINHISLGNIILYFSVYFLFDF